MQEYEMSIVRMMSLGWRKEALVASLCSDFLFR